MPGRPHLLARVAVGTIILVFSLRRLAAWSTSWVAMRLCLRASVELLACRLDGGLGMFPQAWLLHEGAQSKEEAVHVF